MKFAHIETGEVMDPQFAATATDYINMYKLRDWQIKAGMFDCTANWKVVQVNDGTLHNAIINADGTYTNPVVASPPPSGKPPVDQLAALQAQLNTLTAALSAMSPAAATIIQAAPPVIPV